MSISISSRKAKGRKLQKWVCEKISTLFNIEYSYNDDALISPRLMGQSGVDVILRGEVKKKFPFYIECKANEKWDVPGAIRQVKKYTKDNKWLLFMKKNKQDPVVIMDADKFFDIYKF